MKSQEDVQHARIQALYTNSYCQRTKYMAMYTYQTSWHMEVYNIHSIIQNSRNVGKLKTCANSRYHALFSERVKVFHLVRLLLITYIELKCHKHFHSVLHVSTRLEFPILHYSTFFLPMSHTVTQEFQYKNTVGQVLTAWFNYCVCLLLATL